MYHTTLVQCTGTESSCSKTLSKDKSINIRCPAQKNIIPIGLAKYADSKLSKAQDDILLD